MGAVVSMWIVYDHPSDCPEYFVARRWESSAEGSVGTPDTVMSRDLERLRDALPPGLTRLERDIEDDPVILEVWL